MLKLVEAVYYLLDKGVQEETSQFQISPRELQIARNVHFFEKGAWTKRNGYIKRFTNVLTSSPIITGLYELVQKNGTSTFITSANVLYSGAQGAASASAITGGLTFTVGSEGQNLMSFVTFNNKVLGANGIENLWQYNGTTAANVAGSPPVGGILTTFQNFIFLAGNSTYPYRLYFSNDGDETIWTNTDYFDIGDMTSPITGLSVLYGVLYVFTRKAIYSIRGYDRDTFTIDEISLSTGCAAHKSVVKVDNNLVWWSERGPYSFDGVQVHYLGGKIQNIVVEINYGRLAYIVAELYKAKNQVWFSVSTGSNSNNNKVICMTYIPTASEGSGITDENVSFAEYTGMAFNAMATERSTTELDRLYTGSYDGYIYKQDQGSHDNSAGIDFLVKTPPIDMGYHSQFKRFRFLRIFLKQSGNYNLNINYITDFGVGGASTTVVTSVLGSVSLWGTMVFGTDPWGGGSIIKPRISLKASGHHLELIFSNANASQPIVIKGFSILGQMKGYGRN
jgi:hypothetical protein